MSDAAAPLLAVHDLAKAFPAGTLSRRAVHALRGVSFAVGAGETVALVGESGSGKSTIGRILLRLERADRGVVRLDGEVVPVTRGDRPTRGFRQAVQMVFQDPFASLNGANPVRYHLERPLLRHGRATRRSVDAEVRRLLTAVGLGDAHELLSRHPHELSGGQRQRVALARALAPGPRLLVADEPTSMLDVSIRLGVLKLLAQLQRDRGLSILFITHDLASARYLAQRMIVLYAGQVMEVGPTDDVIRSPAHPYTRLLLAATPHAVGTRTSLPVRLPTRVAPVDATGCPFAGRCPAATATCDQPVPVRVVGSNHLARCHLA